MTDRLKYIVTGTGRCGTAFAARALSDAGVPCGHEQVFRFGGVRPDELERQQLAADSSWCAAAFLQHDVAAEAKVVHLVRHPLQVIVSLLASNYYGPRVRPWDRLLLKCLAGLSQQPTRLAKAVHHYVHWNLWIEQQCQGRDYFRHCVEDDFNDLLQQLRIEHRTTFADRRCNTRRRKRRAQYLDHLTWADVPPGKDGAALRALAVRYGYGDAAAPVECLDSSR